MTEIISAELKAQALQKMQLLKNSSNPHEYFYVMLQQPSQYESTMIAYQNLSSQLMLQIVRKIDQSPQHFSFYNQEVLTKLFLCYPKVLLSKNCQVKQKYQALQRKIKIDIGFGCISLVLSLILILVFTKLYLLSDSNRKMRELCDRIDSQTHQQIPINTTSIESPTIDLDLEHIVCTRNTQPSKSIEQKTIMEDVNNLFPQLCLLILVFKFISCCALIVELVYDFRKKYYVQSQLNEIKRQILLSGPPLRIIK